MKVLSDSSGTPSIEATIAAMPALGAIGITELQMQLEPFLMRHDATHIISIAGSEYAKIAHAR